MNFVNFTTEDECPICLDPLYNSNDDPDEIFINVKCQNQHVFHEECITNWYKIEQTCPLCRQDISKEHWKKISSSGYLFPPRSLSDIPSHNVDIFIKMLDYSTITININLYESVDKLYQKIKEQRPNVFINNYNYLVLGGKYLVDMLKTLRDYYVQKESTLIVVRSVRPYR